MSTISAFVETMRQEWTLPDNMEIKWDFDIDLSRVVITVTAVWPDIYRPGQMAQTHSRRSVPCGLIEHNTPDALQMAEHLAMEAIAELWNHELHESVKHYGKHMVNPHPTGRDSFV
jgi:hypothetical protein